MTSRSDGGTTMATYGCVNWANNERTMAYYRWACANGKFPEGCTPEISALCYCADDTDISSDPDPYVDPITDNVCWYDAVVPESADFLGAIILNDPVKGSTFSREVNDSAFEGSILQRPTIRGRSFPFEILLIATSAAGMNYAEEWLRRVFEDALCSSVSSCDSCNGRAMCLRVHCSAGLEEEPADDGIHEWLSVGLLDGLQPVDDSTGHCCHILKKFTFTMHSESPFSFSTTPIEIGAFESTDESYTRCFDWSLDTHCGEPCSDCADGCACSRCLYDPACEVLPFIIPPTTIGDLSCLPCDPLQSVYECLCTEDLPGGYETTFKIDIFSGYAPANAAFTKYGLRDLIVKIYQNPRRLDCVVDDDTFDAWDGAEPCAELRVKYVPSNSTLSIDGRTGRIMLTCDGICRPYGHTVTSNVGSVFPLLARCTPMMVCVEQSYYTTQFDDVAPNKPTSVAVNSYLRFRN